MENERDKIQWDFNKQCHQIEEARRPDIVITHIEETEELIDISYLAMRR